MRSILKNFSSSPNHDGQQKSRVIFEKLNRTLIYAMNYNRLIQFFLVQLPKKYLHLQDHLLQYIYCNKRTYPTSKRSVEKYLLKNIEHEFKTN